MRSTENTSPGMPSREFRTTDPMNAPVWEPSMTNRIYLTDRRVRVERATSDCSSVSGIVDGRRRRSKSVCESEPSLGGRCGKESEVLRGRRSR